MIPVCNLIPDIPRGMELD